MLPEPGEEPRDGRAVERPDIVTHFGPEPVKPPAIDAGRALTAPTRLFVEQERLSQVPDGPARLGMSLCFIRYFRGVLIALIARNALMNKTWWRRRDSNP